MGMPMTIDVDSTRNLAAVIVGVSREAAARVFGDQFLQVLTTTYDEFDADLAGRVPGFVGVAAGPGMDDIVRRALRLLADDAVDSVAVEIPTDLVLADAVRAAVQEAGLGLSEVHRYRDRACLVFGGEEPEKDEGWVLDAVLTAASTSPDERQAHQDRLAHDWELAAVRSRSKNFEHQLETLRPQLWKARRQLRALGQPGEAPAAGSASPGSSVASPPPAGPRSPTARGFLAAASSLLGARSRRGRALTLVVLAAAVGAVLIGLPVAFALVGDATALLTGITMAVTLLVLGGLAALVVLQLRAVKALGRAVANPGPADPVVAVAAEAREPVDLDDADEVDDVVSGAPASPPSTAAELEAARADVQATINLFAMVPVHAAVPPIDAPAQVVEAVDVVLAARPHTIVHAGSGVGILFLALAVEKHDINADIVVLDHDRRSVAAMQALLRKHGVEHRVEVRYAPLARTRLPGHNALWYDETAIQDLSDIGLVVVAGPPDDAGASARYPVVPLLADRLAGDCVILLGGGDTSDDIADRWSELLPDFAAVDGTAHAVALRR